MLSDTFHDRGGVADDPDFSVDLTRSTVTFRTPEILYIFHRNCCTSQGDDDSRFPYLLEVSLSLPTVFNLQASDWVHIQYGFFFHDFQDIFACRNGPSVAVRRIFEFIHCPINHDGISNKCNLNGISCAPCE